MHKMFSDKFPFRRSIVGGDSPSSRRSSAEIAIDRFSSICSFFNMPRAAETNNVLLP